MTNQADGRPIMYNVTATEVTVFVLSMLNPGDYIVSVRLYNMYGVGPDSSFEELSISM